MAIKENYMVKTLEGVGDLELTAKSGESIRVIDIQVAGPASAYAEIKVEKTLCGYFRVSGTLGNHLAPPPADSYRETLLAWMRRMGFWRGIPVAEGEKLSISGVGQAGAVQKVVYEIHEAGDQLPEMPNGSKAKEYDFLNYGRMATFVAGENPYTVQQNPIEYPDFPFEGVVPADKEITLFGVLASDLGKTSGTAANKQRSRFLRMVKDRTTLFDEDRLGLPMRGETPAADGTSVGLGRADFGNFSDVDERLPLVFPAPLKFVNGEELTAYMNTEITLGVANLAATDTEIAFISRVTPKGA